MGFIYGALVVICLQISMEVKPTTALNKQCSPPNGDTCIEIKKCPYFKQLLESSSIPRSPRISRIIRQHHCGFEGNNPKVCCWLSSEETNGIPISKSDDFNIDANLDLLPRSDCGRTTNEFRIIGGSKTSPVEFPWMAILAFYTKHGIEARCGGTLINKRYVLTAAHCVTNVPLAMVRLGEHNILVEKECNEVTSNCAPPVQDFYIEDVIVHPNYNALTKVNDIALVRLSTSANLTYENVHPICLPFGKAADLNLDGKMATVTGWGVTETGFKSEELLKASVLVIPTFMCRRLSYNYQYITKNHICAGGNHGKDSCAGDSGGPLQYTFEENGNARYFQFGIVSYGPKYCGTRGQPGVYTSIIPYTTWIMNNLKPPLH